MSPTTKPFEAVERQRLCTASPLDTIACEYVEVSLGLGERDPDSLDFSVAPPFVAETVRRRYPTLDQLAAKVDSLRMQIGRVKPDTEVAKQRVQALQLQLGATAARIGMLRGQVLPFDVEANALFATEPLPDGEVAQRKAVRAEVARVLAASESARRYNRSRQVSLAERYSAFDRQFLIPPDRLETVMHAAITACREHTLQHLALPAGEGVKLVFVRNQPWSAFSRYKGHGRSTISLNLDLPVTVDEALELACHEGYPGHHVFNTLREQALVSQQHLPEAEVQLTFSPQSYVSEAAAAFAPELALSFFERLRIEQEILFPLAGLPSQKAATYVRICNLVRQLSSAEPAIAHDYLDGHLEFVRAAQAFANEALMAHADASLFYLNEYRSYILAYTDGPRRMRIVLGGNAPVPEKEQWNAFAQLTKALAVTLPGARNSALVACSNASSSRWYSSTQAIHFKGFEHATLCCCGLYRCIE